MMLTSNPVRKQVRSAVKTTRRAMNKALDRAEPRLEDAAEALDELRRDAARGLQRQSKLGRERLREGLDSLQARIASRRQKRSSHALGRTLLITAGVVAVAWGMMR